MVIDRASCACVTASQSQLSFGHADWGRLSRVPSFGRLLMSAPNQPGGFADAQLNAAARTPIVKIAGTLSNLARGHSSRFADISIACDGLSCRTELDGANRMYILLSIYIERVSHVDRSSLPIWQQPSRTFA